MSVELNLSCVEADCKSFPVHRGYNGDSLTGYLRKLATTYCILFYYHADIDIRHPEHPLAKARSIEVVLSINQELRSDGQFLFSSFPCDHLVCSKCITPRHRHGERRLQIGGEFVGTVRIGLLEANRSQRSTLQPDQELTERNVCLVKIELCYTLLSVVSLPASGESDLPLELDLRLDG